MGEVEELRKLLSHEHAENTRLNANWIEATVERDEARQRAERAEALAENRLTVLRQYVAHHSSCQECYGVWAALAADPRPAEAGGEE